MSWAEEVEVEVALQKEVVVAVDEEMVVAVVPKEGVVAVEEEMVVSVVPKEVVVAVEEVVVVALQKEVPPTWMPKVKKYTASVTEFMFGGSGSTSLMG